MCCCGGQIAAGGAPLAKLHFTATCFHLQHSYAKNAITQRRAAAGPRHRLYKREERERGFNDTLSEIKYTLRRFSHTHKHTLMQVNTLRTHTNTHTRMIGRIFIIGPDIEQSRCARDERCRIFWICLTNSLNERLRWLQSLTPSSPVDIQVAEVTISFSEG